MTTPNVGDLNSFFQRQTEDPSNVYLIDQQVDPSQPSIEGLSRVSGPIIPATHSSDNVSNFDPALYDLRPESHLMRLIRAFSGASGVSGLRKQLATSRMSSSITGTNFVDLDKFYGALFNLSRQAVELMPFNYDGTRINPLTDAADSDLWDDIRSRDARYRSRILLLARAINMGGTYYGLMGACEAVLGSGVDLSESWVKTDEANSSINIVLPTAMTFGQISSQKVTYGNVSSSYNTLAGAQFGAGSLPLGNRGEIVVTPHRSISLEESHQLQQVLSVLKPAFTQVTIATLQNAVSTPVQPRGFSSDSENWRIQAKVTPAIGLVNGPVPLYQNAGPRSLARPAFSEYDGESWSYVPNVIKTKSYRMQNNYVTSTSDRETVTFQDGTVQTYEDTDAVMDSRQALSVRLSGDGVVTNFPYSGNRIIYQTVRPGS